MTIRNRPHSLGFTLLEIMLVLGIIAAVIAFGLPKLASPNAKIRSSLRQMTALPGQITNQARLHGNLYRWVIDLGENEKVAQKHWVERSTSLETIVRDRDQDADSSDESQPPEFQRAPRLGDRDREIPKPLRIVSVEIEGLERPIESGVAHIHFFPQGRVEEAIIQLSDGEKLFWSLMIHPITGQTHLSTQRMSLRDLRK